MRMIRECQSIWLAIGDDSSFQMGRAAWGWFVVARHLRRMVRSPISELESLLVRVRMIRCISVGVSLGAGEDDSHDLYCPRVGMTRNVARG